MGSNIIATPKKRFPADLEYTFQAKMNRHRHNALSGSGRQAYIFCQSVQDSPSCTEKQKTMALQIQTLITALNTDIYSWRVEPNGEVVAPKHDYTR